MQILEYYSFDKVRGLGHPDIDLCSAFASLLNRSSEHVTGSCIWSSAASDLLDKPKYVAAMQVNKWVYWAYELCFCAFFFFLAWLALAYKQHQKR